MKKSRVFMAVGACVLAITGVFATMANKQFVPINSADFIFSGTYSGSGTMILPNGHFTALSSSALPKVYIGLFTWSSSCPSIIIYTAITKSNVNVYIY